MPLRKSLDTIYTVNTPEGIHLTLSPAGPMARMLAWMIDVLIRFVIYTITFIILGILGSSGAGITLILTFLVEWFYPVYFELLKNGQTPGKKSLNIYVVQDNGSPVTPAASMIRNLLRFVDFFPFLYGFGLASMLLNKRFQRLGDLVAGTVVLYKEETLVEESLESGTDKEEAHQAIAPSVRLKIEEQQTILQFRQRQRTLSKDRAEELAGTSGVLLADAKKGEKAVYLTRIANWIAGIR